MSEPLTGREPADVHPSVHRARLSISLTGEALAAAEAIAQEHGVSEGEAVRRAIAVLKFLSDEMAAGTVFRMQAPNSEPERFRLVFA
ncbi:hypothetical protein [Actinomadura napierensis]